MTRGQELCLYQCSVAWQEQFIRCMQFTVAEGLILHQNTGGLCCDILTAVC